MERLIKVKGMHCHSCEKLLSMAINEVDGVSVKSIDYKTGEITIDYKDEGQLELVKKIIEDNGYTLFD